MRINVQLTVWYTIHNMLEYAMHAMHTMCNNCWQRSWMAAWVHQCAFIGLQIAKKRRWIFFLHAFAYEYVCFCAIFFIWPIVQTPFNLLATILAWKFMSYAYRFHFPGFVLKIVLQQQSNATYAIIAVCNFECVNLICFFFSFRF